MAWCAGSVYRDWLSKWLNPAHYSHGGRLDRHLYSTADDTDSDDACTSPAGAKQSQVGGKAGPNVGRETTDSEVVAAAAIVIAARLS